MAIAGVIAGLTARTHAQDWIRQFGTSEGDYVRALAPDGAGGVMVAGNTEASLGEPNAGRMDAFLARYDSAGERLWIRQFGTGGHDYAFGVAPDGAGGVMVAGFTYGDLGGIYAGLSDAYLARFDSGGERLWIRQFGTSSVDDAWALAPDGAGGVMVAGFTWGNLGDRNAGLSDGFVAHFSACDPCDMNCDAMVNSFDIEPFLDLLFHGVVPCNICTGDVNGDGFVDAADIEGFIECLFP